jgi:LPXTG-motif cell wall-anchored protein
MRLSSSVLAAVALVLAVSGFAWSARSETGDSLPIALYVVAVLALLGAAGIYTLKRSGRH